jgi:hypothetical protein
MKNAEITLFDDAGNYRSVYYLSGMDHAQLQFANQLLSNALCRDYFAAVGMRDRTTGIAFSVGDDLVSISGAQPTRYFGKYSVSEPHRVHGEKH